MIIAYVSPEGISQIYERLGYGLFLIALTIGIGVAMALVVRPKK